MTAVTKLVYGSPLATFDEQSSAVFKKVSLDWYLKCVW